MIKADFHIHTVLSPCGDIEMTPAFIVSRAKERSISVIGITDHNSTLQVPQIIPIAEREGIFVLAGAEITSKEEVHILAFVDGEENRCKLQSYIDFYLPKIQNNVDYFGYQLVVDEEERVLCEVEYLLINAISRSLSQITEFVHSLGGIVIPAHIDKRQNSLMSQLGFVPPDLDVDAFELSPKMDRERFIRENPYLKNRSFVHSSDAHYPADFGDTFTKLDIHGELSFESIKSALKNGVVYE